MHGDSNSARCAAGNTPPCLNVFNAHDTTNPGFENPSSVTDLDGTIICQLSNGSYDASGCK